MLPSPFPSKEEFAFFDLLFKRKKKILWKYKSYHSAFSFLYCLALKQYKMPELLLKTAQKYYKRIKRNLEV